MIEDSIGIKQNSKTLQERTSCGTLYLTVVYGEDGGIDCFKIHVGSTARENQCGGSYLEAIADLLTFGYKRCNRTETELEALIKCCSFHRCNKAFIGCLSCVNSISKMLKKEFSNEISKDGGNIKPVQDTKEVA